MPPAMTGALRAALRWTWTLAALAVIAYAVLVAAGRELLPRLDDLQPRIDRMLSRRLGAAVEVRGIDGDWTGFAPRLRLAAARFAPAPGATEFVAIEGFAAELDLLRSALGRQPAWSDLEVQRLRIRLTETATGWRLNGGAETEPGARAAVQRLLSVLLAGRRTRIADTQLTLQFRSGDQAVLSARDLLLENRGSFHRAGGRIAMAGRDLATLEAEWRAADPIADWAASRGRAHARFSRLDLSGSLGVLLRGLTPEWLQRLAPTDVPIDAELWLEASGDGRAELRGRAGAPRLALQGELATEPLRDLRAEITGWIAPGRDWGLCLQNLAFAWRDYPIEPLTLAFRQPLGTPGPPRFTLAADHLDLATANAMVLAAGVLPERAAAALAALNPSGRLLEPWVEIDLGNPDLVTGARAVLDQVAVDSWRRSPAVRGVSGNLAATARRATLTLAGSGDTELRFPTAYDHFLRVGQVRGRVDFALAEDLSRLELSGTGIEVAAADGAGTIAAAFRLDQPLRAGGEGELWLSAGIRDTHAGYARQYLPKVLEPPLAEWLAAALGEMSIPEGAFIWRGTVAREAGAQRTIQVYARVADATVRFDPQWPELTGVDAQVAVDDIRVSGSARRAAIAGIPVRDLRFHSFPSPESGKPLLAVTATAATQVDRGLGVLTTSPLRERVAALDSWQTGGEVSVGLDLAIPLSKDHRGERYRVDARLADASLSHRDSGLRFERIRGELKFSESDGLRADALQARLWGQDLTATLRGDPQGGIEIVSTGEVVPAQLPGWPRWLGEHVSGTATYRAQYRIPGPGETPRLVVTSDLLQLTSALPAPFAKPADQPLPLRLELAFGDRRTDLDAALGDRLRARAQLAGGQPRAIAVALGDAAPQLPGSGLEIRGHLETLDLDAWLGLWPGTGAGAGAALAQLTPHLELRVDHLRGGGLELDGISIAAARGADGWDLRADSETLAGRLRLPAAAGQPLQLDLDHLVLPKPDLAPGNRLAALDPASLPELDFSTLGLRVGERELGQLAFSLRRLPDGLRAQEIRGEITGLRAGEGEHRPALEWRRQGEDHRTRFAGTILSDDLAGVLRAWQLPGAIESEQAELVAELSWAGRPWEVRAHKLHGELAVHVRKGTFRRATGGPSNAVMKLIGLVNFDTWLRRLQLDFSDLFANGMAFDELDTRLAFEAGALRFAKPVKVELPAGKMRLEGSADLIAETIDAHLVATLPVGTNLPWIAALAGGLPAAAGVYLTSRIFDRQVDRISSLGYRVTGPWDEPRIKVERIFSDPTRDQTGTK